MTVQQRQVRLRALEIDLRQVPDGPADRHQVLAPAELRHAGGVERLRERLAEPSASPSGSGGRAPGSLSEARSDPNGSVQASRNVRSSNRVSSTLPPPTSIVKPLRTGRSWTAPRNPSRASDAPSITWSSTRGRRPARRARRRRLPPGRPRSPRPRCGPPRPPARPRGSRAGPRPSARSPRDRAGGRLQVPRQPQRGARVLEHVEVLVLAEAEHDHPPEFDPMSMTANGRSSALSRMPGCSHTGGEPLVDARDRAGSIAHRDIPPPLRAHRLPRLRGGLRRDDPGDVDHLHRLRDRRARASTRCSWSCSAPCWRPRTCSSRSPPGVVADVVSRRLSVVIGVFGCGVAFLVLAAAPGFGLAVVSQVLYGVFATFTERRRRRVDHRRGGGAGGASPVPGRRPGLAPRRARRDRAGVGLALVDLRLPVYVGAAGILLLGVWMAFAMPEEHFVRAGARRRRAASEPHMRRTFRDGVARSGGTRCSG